MNARIGLVFIRRGAAVWLAARLLAGLLMYASGASALNLPFSVRIMLILLTVTVGFIHSMRHHERVFLANLGVHVRTMACLLALPAVVGEIVSGLLVEIMP
jgi:hypothetical protein